MENHPIRRTHFLDWMALLKTVWLCSRRCSSILIFSLHSCPLMKTFNLLTPHFNLGRIKFKGMCWISPFGCCENWVNEKTKKKKDSFLPIVFIFRSFFSFPRNESFRLNWAEYLDDWNSIFLYYVRENEISVLNFFLYISQPPNTALSFHFRRNVFFLDQCFMFLCNASFCVDFN